MIATGIRQNEMSTVVAPKISRPEGGKSARRGWPAPMDTRYTTVYALSSRPRLDRVLDEFNQLSATTNITESDNESDNPVAARNMTHASGSIRRMCAIADADPCTPMPHNIFAEGGFFRGGVSRFRTPGVYRSCAAIATSSAPIRIAVYT